MRLSLIGHSTPEAVPLFHLYPGGSVMRIVARPARSLECVEGASFEICQLTVAERLAEAEVEDEILARLAASWGVKAIFLDGLEPSEVIDARRLASVTGLEIAARSHGLAEPEASYVLLEDISELVGREEMRTAFFRAAERLAGRARLELAVYLLRPSEAALEHAELSAYIGAPLHVHLANHGGGGPAKRLYEELRRRSRLVYLHAGLYSELDTHCSCGALLMRRSEGYLLGSQLKDGACPRCSTRLPIFGEAAQQTSPSLRRVLRGGVAWYTPQLYAGFLAFKGRGAKEGGARL